jgi:hypothetical protein
MTNVIPLFIQDESIKDIARRYGVSTQTLRFYCRQRLSWHAYYDRWTWPIDSAQHRDMEVVAWVLSEMQLNKVPFFGGGPKTFDGVVRFRMKEALEEERAKVQQS